MTRRRFRRQIPVVFGLALVAGACGGSAADTGSGTAEGTGESVGSPIEQLFGNASVAQRALEDRLAVCMRERGWQYTPNTAAFTDAEIGTDPTADPKFREQYGYGISTQPPPEAWGGVVVDSSKDPNNAYVETLSEDDKQRYYKDLWGGNLFGSTGGDTATATGMATAFEDDPNSCQSMATEAVAKDYPQLSKAFTERVGELFEAMENDPKMTSAISAWSACMARSSFTFASVDEVYEDLQRRSTELFGDSGSVAAAVSSNGPQGTPATMAVADKERLAELQREEKAIAKADAACRVDTVDKVRPALEQDVVDKIRSEFPGIGGTK